MSSHYLNRFCLFLEHSQANPLYLCSSFIAAELGILPAVGVEAGLEVGGGGVLMGAIVLAMHLDSRSCAVALIHDSKAEIAVSVMVKILAVNNRVHLPRDLQVTFAKQGIKLLV